MFEVKRTDNHEPEMPTSTRNRNAIPLDAAPPEPPQQVAHAHLLVHMSNDYTKRQELVTKLRNAGCDVDTTGSDWVKAGNFVDPLVRTPAKIKKKRRS